MDIMKRLSQFAMLVLFLVTAFSAPSLGGECTDNNWQPTFVRHDSVPNSYYVAPGGSFVLVMSPDDAQRICQAQGVRERITGQDCSQRRWGDFGCGCNLTPSRNSTCAAFQQFLNNSAAQFLGSVWNEEESGWTGAWTRRGGSNIFDALWITPKGQRQQSVLTITIRGYNVRIDRRDPNGGTCTYDGIINPSARTVQGSYSCAWARGPIPWSARIR
jgi:hypothetical protein